MTSINASASHTLTVALIHSGTDAEQQALEKSVSAIQKHLNQHGGFFNYPVRLELFTGYLRDVDSSRRLAIDLARRDDVIAVSFWGGTWLAPATSLIIQAFLDESREQPFIVLSGTVLPEHTRHPGSFSLAPVLRDKNAIIRFFLESLQEGNSVGYLGKEGLDDIFSTTVENVCKERKLRFHKVLMPPNFPYLEPTECDFLEVCRRVEAVSHCSIWMIGLYPLNRPLRSWLYDRDPSTTIISVNSGRKLEWFNGNADVGDIFFGHDNFRERKDAILSKELGLEDDFPRWRIDSLLLLQKAATLVPSNLLETATTRKELFQALLIGMLSIDGNEAVLEGTRFCFWFNRLTRNNCHGAVALKRRLSGEKGLFYPLQARLSDDGALHQVPVVYFYLDMLYLWDIDLSEETFGPTFYLDLRATADIGLSDLHFINLEGDWEHSELLHDCVEEENGIKFHVRRYKLSGTFGFLPQLENYPMDRQFVNIELAPSNPLGKGFLLQPVESDKQDINFEVAGWTVIGGEISCQTRFWVMPTSSRFQMRHIPYQAVSCAWTLQRKSLDNVLRVGIPLGLLLFVSYFPVLSSQEQAGDMSNMLITSLLATIALYFCINKPVSDRMTLLDRAFLVSYLAIGLLLATVMVASQLAPETYRILMSCWALLYPLLLIGEAVNRTIKHRMGEKRMAKVDSND